MRVRERAPHLDAFGCPNRVRFDMIYIDILAGFTLQNLYHIEQNPVSVPFITLSPSLC